MFEHLKTLARALLASRSPQSHAGALAAVIAGQRTADDQDTLPSAWMIERAHLPSATAGSAGRPAD